MDSYNLFSKKYVQSYNTFQTGGTNQLENANKPDISKKYFISDKNAVINFNIYDETWETYKY